MGTVVAGIYLQIMAHHRDYPRDRILVSEIAEVLLIVFAFALSYYLVESDMLVTFLRHLSEVGDIVAALVQGFFFTSMVTTVPAIVAISESSHVIPALQLAFFGGIGAVLGDLFVFRFVRSRLAEHVLRVLFSPHMRRVGTAFSRGPLRFVGPLLGIIIIASPFPDEIGLAMLGLSEIRLVTFVPLVFVANAGGILLIALASGGSL